MEVYIKDKAVGLIINYKNNKNIYFRFDDNLNLVVNVSKRVKEKEIYKLIKENEEALAKLLIKSQKKLNKNKEFWYLGNKYEIKYADVKEITFEGLIIYVKDNKMLDKFLKDKTKEIFEAEVLKLKGIIKTSEFTLKIRKMKTRWGVCNYKNNSITLNSELIKYTIDALRYVIIHEMCHFYHHDHSASFWQMVEEYAPNYKRLRKELKN